MRCRKCGHNNDYDASFCEKCGANLRAPADLSTLTKVLIITVVVLVGVLGVVGGMMLMNNQSNPANNTSTHDTTTDASQTPTQSTQSSSTYKTFSNGIISFQYPSNWDVLPNGANTMVIVGGSDYPHFSVYDESKYGHKSLTEYISECKNGMRNDGFSIRSERSRTIDGLPAYEIIFQGDNKILHMVLVEKSKGKQYFALEGVDYINHYEQETGTFNQILNSFQFL